MSIIWKLIRHYKKETIILFIIVQIAAVLECFGLAMLLPFLQQAWMSPIVISWPEMTSSLKLPAPFLVSGRITCKMETGDMKSNLQKLRGTIVPVPGHFDESGAVDTGLYREHTAFLVGKGVSISTWPNPHPNSST